MWKQVEKNEWRKGWKWGKLPGEKGRPECEVPRSKAIGWAQGQKLCSTSNFSKARRTPDSCWDTAYSCLKPVAQKCKFYHRLYIWYDLKDTRWSIWHLSLRFLAFNWTYTWILYYCNHFIRLHCYLENVQILVLLPGTHYQVSLDILLLSTDTG